MGNDTQTKDYIQQLFAKRIGGSNFGLGEEIYKFEIIKRAKKEAIESNPAMELIDLGVGEPDSMADQVVRDRLIEEVSKPENRFYADNGIETFKKAAASYMSNVFGVKDLDPETEINHAIGSKSALSMIPTAFINPGDITIMPTPNYPIIGTHTEYLGGKVVYLPLMEEHHFLPKLDILPASILEKAKLLYLNYPNNPTGATATKEFFEEVVRFAKKHELIVIHDAAYASLVFDGEQPLSFLSVPGAKDVGIELHSLSKSFNMTGWRIGFVTGNKKLVSAFKMIKDNYDSGQFIPIQKAAALALSKPEITEKTAAKYARRHKLLVSVLQACGFQVEIPKGSFFLYTQIPIGVKNGPTFQTAEDFSQYLIKKLLLSTVPWDDAGSYIRFSVTFQAEGIKEEQKVMEEIESRLKSVEFIFEGGD
ncbi:LL-diaminopimelate aminotransferase [Oceanobacillus halophilus]|uniref:Aminotransferase n=1 Tax=Oceanobacillus halophilus TaxID=930130 RepID=A0A495A771_9BACI|nr:LL-diaminopimelate aminotransferase [Oceanobacillus halophilus]RKQ35628.1 LL-diaminopimelate aminotransferase [Oceanobacillus halophilus]